MDSEKIKAQEAPVNTESPNKASALERLNEECASLRQKLTQAQGQKFQQLKTIQRQQGEIKLAEVKYQSALSELEQKKLENKQYLDAYESEKRQRLEMLTKQQTVLNDLNRDGAQLSKFTKQNAHLKEQLDQLSKELESEKSQRVGALRDKQNVANQIRVLETKLEAAEMQAKYSKVSSQELENENKRLKEELKSMSEKVHTTDAPLQPQTIYKDQNSTTEKLLKQFEVKMSEKDAFLKKEIESYERKNATYIKRIAELQEKLGQR